MKIKPGYKLRKMCGSSIVVAVGKGESSSYRSFWNEEGICFSYASVKGFGCFIIIPCPSREACAEDDYECQ